MGAFSASFEHTIRRKAIEGQGGRRRSANAQVLVQVIFNQARFLDIVRNFTIFSDEAEGLVKRVAKYHQYWAVNAAVRSTVEAALEAQMETVVVASSGIRKAAEVVEMLLYGAKVMRDPRMNNPTLVFLTDRNDLDDQLFGEVFAPAEILPEHPVRADSRADLRALLKRASGKSSSSLLEFAIGQDDDRSPVLTDRLRVVVVADEGPSLAVRLFRDALLSGLAAVGARKGHARCAAKRHLSPATAPRSTDKSTRTVFVKYIDVYDLTRAVEDGATVKIFYESRLAKVSLSEADYEALDELAEGDH